MSISKFELIDALEKIAAVKSAESWDNCGMQIDLNPEKIHKILVTLEITKENMTEAIGLGVDFIVTHHPLYFSGFKNIDSNSITGNYSHSLIKHDISVYSAHTSFDKAPFGNNFYLAKLLDLKNIKNFEGLGEEYIGLYGELEENTALEAMIDHIKACLDLKRSEMKIVGDLESKIHRVGLCTGAGSEMLEIAQRCGCELFITGDVKYHDGIKAAEMGINVIDGGHYGTEKIFVPNMAGQLREHLSAKVEIFESEIDINPFIV